MKEWEQCQRISDLPDVHGALLEFSEDATGSNGVYVVREVLRAIVQAPQPVSQPARVARRLPTTAFPTITDEEMSALRRFNECVSDGEGYDVGKEMMRRLSGIGLVRRTSGSIYEHTDFGLCVLGEYIPSEAQHGR